MFWLTLCLVVLLLGCRAFSVVTPQLQDALPVEEFSNQWILNNPPPLKISPYATASEDGCVSVYTVLCFTTDDRKGLCPEDHTILSIREKMPNWYKDWGWGSNPPESFPLSSLLSGDEM